MSIVGALLGSYRVIDELSSGGMGAVYRARHELLGRLVAVKVLRPELTSNPELVNRFFTEARASSAIRHPGIVEVFDFGYTADQRAYLVMELLDGESLADRIDRGRIAELDAARIARGIASALGAAHAKGIVHRDLKPDNVMIVPDPERPDAERTKVLDFGIAKLADPSGAPLGTPSDSHPTQTGALIGTPLYMAPEQARAASAIDHRADLYSLGCILYEMVVGAPPFEGVGAGEVIALQLFGEVVPPRTRVPEVSRALEAIVMRLLEKQPADRFQSAADVSAALDQAIGTPSPSLAMPVTPAPRRTRGALPYIAGLVTLAIVAGGVILFATGGGAAPARPAPAPPPVHAPELVRETPAARPPAVQPTAPAPAPAEVVKPKQRTPKKPKPCDGHKGEHTDNCSPIETAPL